MKKRANTTLLQEFCESCSSEGFFKLPESLDEESILLQCSNCSTLIAEVWCPNCKMGGQIAEADLENHSSYWHCVECKKKHEFPKGFYEKKHSLKVKTPGEYFFNTLNHINPSYVPYKWIKEDIKDFKKEEKFYVFSFLFLFILSSVLMTFKIFLIGSVLLISSLVIIFTYLFFNILYWSISQCFYIVARIKNKDKN